MGVEKSFEAHREGQGVGIDLWRNYLSFCLSPVTCAPKGLGRRKQASSHSSTNTSIDARLGVSGDRLEKPEKVV